MGETVSLSSEGSRDPDDNDITVQWFQYREAGTFKDSIELSEANAANVSFKAPELKEKECVHVILQIRDNGVSTLTSYRRKVIEVVS